MEIWKSIKGYKGLYEISNIGRVKSKTGRIRKQVVDKDEYKRINLYKNGERLAKLYRVCRLVAEAFLKNPENKPQVNHKNGIKSDDNLKNLEWCTVSENMQHSYNNGLHKKGEKHYLAKISDLKVKAIRKFMSLRPQMKQVEVAKIFGISQPSISEIKRYDKRFQYNNITT